MNHLIAHYWFIPVSGIAGYWLLMAVAGVVQGIRAAIHEQRRLNHAMAHGLTHLPARSRPMWQGRDD